MEHLKYAAWGNFRNENPCEINISRGYVVSVSKTLSTFLYTLHIKGQCHPEFDRRKHLSAFTKRS